MSWLCGVMVPVSHLQDSGALRIVRCALGVGRSLCNNLTVEGNQSGLESRGTTESQHATELTGEVRGGSGAKAASEREHKEMGAGRGEKGFFKGVFLLSCHVLAAAADPVLLGPRKRANVNA